MKRRDFIKTGLKVGVAMNALPLMISGMPVRAIGRSMVRTALAQKPGNRVLVIIQLAGGNDGLNCVVPHSDPLYAELRPTLGLKRTNDNLLLLPDHDSLALHSSMSGMHDLYKSGKLAVIQNVGYPNPDLSHFRGTDIWNTASDSGRYLTTGWIGRLLGDLNPDYPPPSIPQGSHPLAIEFGNALSNVFLGKNGGMGIAINKLPLSENDSTHDYDTSRRTSTAVLDYVRTIEKETEVYTTALADRSVKSNKATYADAEENPVAQQLANVAQCIASGLTTQVYLVSQSGYDTHSDQLTEQARLLKELSDAVASFQQDLEAFGVADRVLGMTYSEFGRRPKENGSGTDHGTAAPMFLLGSQVSAGVIGHDPDLKNLVSGNLAFDPQHDFRNVYATIMSSWLGVSDSEIRNVLTANNGETYSDIGSWQRLNLTKGA